MKKRLKKISWALWERIARLAARSYVAGPALEDAIEACRRLAAARVATTVCYWNTEQEAPRTVAAAYLDALDALARGTLDCRLSVKAPALGFNRRLLRDVCERGRGVPLHFDALAPEAADETFALIVEMLALHPDIGCTLPGRWRRSPSDADWASERGVAVRVVKGQWADPEETPGTDPRNGFLAVIDRLAGRARHVRVATHDAPLAREALARLLRKNTPCELELLFGLPSGPARRVAQAAGVNIRFYIPYGHGWVPYCISQVYQNPRMLRRVFQDVFVHPWSRLPGPVRP